MDLFASILSYSLCERVCACECVRASAYMRVSVYVYVRVCLLVLLFLFNDFIFVFSTHVSASSTRKEWESKLENGFCDRSKLIRQDL